jgi:hypothetical protein
LRDESLIKIIDRFSSEKICSMSLLHKLLSFINKISEIKDSIQRCCAYCLAHSCLKRLDTVCEYESMRAHLLSSLNASWQCMDVIWAKIDTGLRIVHSLAEDIPELAQKYFKEIDLLRENMVFNTPSTASLYQTCLRLIVRAFSGILLRNFDTNDDFTRLSDLINYLPSNGEKSEVWAELALRCFIARRSDLGRDIVSNHVKPLLYSIPDSDCSYKNNTIVSIIPALYMAHATTAKELIQTLPLDKQDRALARVIEFLLRRQPLSDPYESHDQGYNVDYDTIIEIIDLIQEIKMDYFVYHFIECIADTVNNTNRFRIKFTPQHRAEITNRLEKIVQTKFPDLNNIHHEGYKIAAEAQIARIRQSKTQVWEELLVKARNIPNISDRSIVLAMIGRAMPSRESEKRKKTFIEAITVAKKIPSILDQIERLVDLSSIIINITSDLAIECLKLAMKLIVNREAYGSSSKKNC